MITDLQALEKAARLVSKSSAEGSVKAQIGSLLMEQRKARRNTPVEVANKPDARSESVRISGRRTVIQTHDGKGRWSFTVSVSGDGSFLLSANGGSMVVRSKGGIRALCDAVQFAADWYESI